MTFRRIVVLAFLFVSIVQTASADTGDERSLALSASPDGRVRVRMTISPAEPSLADTIRLTLTVWSDPTLRIKMPEFGSAVGNLRILNRSEQTVAIVEDMEQRSLVLTLVPTREGNTPIWPMLFRYSDRQQNASEQSQSLELAATELVIKANIAPEDVSLEGIGSSRDIIDIPDKSRGWIVLLALVSLIGTVLFLFLRRRRCGDDLRYISRFTCQEIALQKLAELIEKRLQETDIKQFYMELTGIVRWYIEQQTLIHAPELTTEEFLWEYAQQSENRTKIPPEQMGRLKLFLESSDMVKFAKFKPLREEIMLGFRHAEEFITTFQFSDISS